MTPVYIIHPYKGKSNDYTLNLNIIKRLSRALVKKYNIVPVNPVLNFAFLNDTTDRDLALELCLKLLETVVEANSEVWVFGKWWESEGCIHEVKRAIELGARIRVWRPT